MGDQYYGPNYTLSIDKDRRDIDVSSKIARLMPDETPFSVFLMRARKVTVGTAEYSWYDSEPGAWWTTITAAALVGDTVLTLADETIAAPSDIFKITRTGEVIFVVSVDTAAHTITVLRGYGTTAAAAINDDDRIMRMGNAMKEFSGAPDTKLKQPSKGYNYTQIFRTPFDQSMTGYAEDLKTAENERTRLRQDKAVEHRLDIERAFIFGERKEDVTNKRRMSGGLMSFITTNVVDVSAGANGLTEAEFEGYCEVLFKYGSKTKLFVCSPKIGSMINAFAAGKIQTKSGEKTYGLQIGEYQSYHGKLLIITSQTFENEYAGMGIGLEMKNVAYRPLKGRDTKLKTNIQSNDADGWRDEYFTEAGLEVRLEKTHAILEGAV